MSKRFTLPVLRATRAVLVLGLAAVGSVSAVRAAEPTPKVGSEAKDFELAALGGEKVKLSKLAESGPVVLVMLRGYPGYQCPICTKQFTEFRGNRDA